MRKPSSDVAFTAAVKAVQERRGSRTAYARVRRSGDTPSPGRAGSARGKEGEEGGGGGGGGGVPCVTVRSRRETWVPARRSRRSQPHTREDHP